MERIADFLKREAFLRTLFDAIPCGVLVVDSRQEVQAVNQVVERTFDVPSGEVLNRRGGDVLGCVEARENPDGCGFSEACARCQVRATAAGALEGKRVQRNRAALQVYIEGRPRDVVLLVSAAPVRFGNRPFAIVMLEDITELHALRRRLRTEQRLGSIVGRDAKMLELFDTIRDLARVGAPVLIEGESGTGKELVASTIHRESDRSKKPFVTVNCGALPEGLLESELFGHVRGAFTGAVRDKKGRFELADGGTLFLDEVAEISPSMQVKLLRVLQDGSFERVGGERTLRVDVRLISATNKDLAAEVRAGRFRDDLYYRLCVVPLRLPPLRDRPDDIPLLARHVLRQALEDSGRPVVTLSDEALQAIQRYPWPGNVRELQNAIQYALVKCRGSTLLPGHLPPVVQGSPTMVSGAHRRRRKLNPASVRAALERTDGNKSQAARLLHVGRATLYRFLRDGGLA